MTAPARSRSLLSLLGLLGLLAAVVAIVASSTVVASATTSAGPETRVRANAHSIETRVGAEHRVVAGRVGRDTFVYDQFVSATGVATEEAAGAAVDVGHAGIHQFPGVTAGKSQFFDGANLGRLADTGDLAGVVQKNGNIRYLLRGAGDVGIDRTTGLPTDIYTVIRKPDGSVLTMFPGTSPMS